MTPWVALWVWSFTILFLSFYLGRRCGWLDERYRCAKAVREERHNHALAAEQSAWTEDTRQKLRGELWIYDKILERVHDSGDRKGQV